MVSMPLRTLLCAIALAAACSAQPMQPDLGKQRAAMKKLAFLVGSWSGEATVHARGMPLKLTQTEEVAWKLDGLVLLIEGTGRHPDTGAVMFTALATVSYDNVAGEYRLRSHREGRYLDVPLQVLENGFEWSYNAGPAVVSFVMRLNAKGEWLETGEVKPGINATRPTFEMTVRKK